ncbi:GNAT family N-acetyltransferase [Bacteroidota bacterium]
MPSKKNEVISLMMIRDHLLDYPRFDVPPGYSIRYYVKGDYNAWLRIHSEAEPYHKVDRQLFFEQFGDDEKIIRDRQFFVCDHTGKEVGTATAWFNDDLVGRNYGRIHWVAVSPDHQGKGLAKALTTRLCDRFVELAHTQALLTTENFRVDAIHIYMKFGFIPSSRNEREKVFWEYFKNQINK